MTHGLILQAAHRCIRLAGRQPERPTLEESRRLPEAPAPRCSVVRIVRYNLYAVIQAIV
jgi:hypothetical protein